MSLNERFTRISEVVSEGLGHYLFTIISLAVLVIWVLYGALVLAHQVQDGAWFTSQEWNFPLNTITTVGEWFIGALVAAAANRVERRNKEINERELALQEKEAERSVEAQHLLQVVRDHTEVSKGLHEITLNLLEKLKKEEDEELALARRASGRKRKVK